MRSVWRFQVTPLCIPWSDSSEAALEAEKETKIVNRSPFWEERQLEFSLMKSWRKCLLRFCNTPSDIKKPEQEAIQESRRKRRVPQPDCRQHL
mmetsp:Transcript_47761/g.94248  ORF Transcript_47761/g.94248 Transcript_47761/m.94248 type:complete len:93 (+) Transcript_47761:1017-1295(+)